ncbi:MAG: hypothetical protein U0931_27125 [Vulcanimicrobiota bacterium]
MGRWLLLCLLWLACPVLGWAEDEFCGPIPHFCGRHPHQLCRCSKHELCTSQPHPVPQVLPGRPEALCPPSYVLVIPTPQPRAPMFFRLKIPSSPPALPPDPPPPRLQVVS